VRALIQRVSRAEVSVLDGVDPEVVGQIGAGLVALVGVTHDDVEATARTLATKIAHLRVLPGPAGSIDRSVLDVGAAVLVVSQFTLYADTRRGRRPSFLAAASPEQAEPLIDLLVTELRSLGVEVATGRFRTDMRVSLDNDGPVTLLLEV